MSSLLSNNEGQKKDVEIFFKHSIKLCCTLFILQNLLNHQTHKTDTQKMLFRGLLSFTKGKEFNWSSVLSLFKVLFKIIYDYWYEIP